MIASDEGVQALLRSGEVIMLDLEQRIASITLRARK